MRSQQIALGADESRKSGQLRPLVVANAGGSEHRVVFRQQLVDFAVAPHFSSIYDKSLSDGRKRRHLVSEPCAAFVEKADDLPVGSRSPPFSVAISLCPGLVPMAAFPCSQRGLEFGVHQILASDALPVFDAPVPFTAFRLFFGPCLSRCQRRIRLSWLISITESSVSSRSGDVRNYIPSPKRSRIALTSCADVSATAAIRDRGRSPDFPSGLRPCCQPLEEALDELLTICGRRLLGLRVPFRASSQPPTARYPAGRNSGA